MPIYTVVAAAQKKTVEGQNGPMQVINLTLDDGSGQPIAAEWFTKASTNVPAAGERLEGDITNDPQWGNKFKRAQRGGFGGGGGGWRDDPKVQASILRQHSQHMALQLLAIAFDREIIAAPDDGAALFQLLSATADWFDRDVNRKADAAVAPQPQGGQA